MEPGDVEGLALAPQRGDGGGLDGRAYVLLAGAEGTAFGRVSQPAVEVTAVSEFTLHDMAWTEPPDGGRGQWWFVGDRGTIAWEDSAGLLDAGYLTTDDDGSGNTTLYGAWPSPQGTLWAVGNHGMVFRVPSGDFVREAVAQAGPQSAVRDLSVSNGHLLAVGDNAVWSFDAGWVSTSDWDRLVAVAALPGGAVTLDAHGMLRHGSITWQLDAGDPPYFSRHHGGLSAGPDGEVWAAFGNQVGVYSSGDGGWTPLTPLDVTHLTDVHVDEAGTVWLGGLTAEDDDVRDGGLYVFDADAGQFQLYERGAVLALNPLPDGEGVVALRPKDYLRCQPDGGRSGHELPMFSVPLGVPVSIWETADSGTWFLGFYGDVWHCPANVACVQTSWQQEPFPWPVDVEGRRPLATRLKGTATHLFVAGERGAILSRPLP